MALIIFVITQTKRAQSEICLALNDSEFHGLFKNADSLNHKHFLDNEKDQTNLEPFFLGHPVCIMSCIAYNINNHFKLCKFP